MSPAEQLPPFREQLSPFREQLPPFREQVPPFREQLPPFRLTVSHTRQYGQSKRRELLTRRIVTHQNTCTFSRTAVISQNSPFFLLLVANTNVFLQLNSHSQWDEASDSPYVQFFLYNSTQWRTEGGGWGVQTPSPRNFEGPPKLCQTQPDCENC